MIGWSSLLLVAIMSVPAEQTCPSDNGWQTVDRVPETDLLDVVVSPRGHVLTLLRDISHKRAKSIIRGSLNGGQSWSTQQRRTLSPRDDLSRGQLLLLPGGDLYVGEMLVRDYSHFKSTTVPRDIWSISQDLGRTSKVVDLRLPLGRKLTWANNRFWAFGDETEKSSRLERWIVEVQQPDTMKWRTVDSFTTDGQMFVTKMIADTDGRLFVIGRVTGNIDGRFQGFWIVRRSTDNGETWTTVDRYSHAPSGDAGLPRPNAIAIGPKGEIYVAGSHLRYRGSAGGWLVRVSRDHGSTWQLVDSGPEGYTVRDIAVTPEGIVFAAGSLMSVEDSPKRPPETWIVKASFDGRAWHETDRFVHEQADYWAERVVVTPSGVVIVVGRGMVERPLGKHTSRVGYAPLLIRRLPCAHAFPHGSSQ